MVKKYCSFLLCIHEGNTNVYINGIPIGQIINGEFKIQQLDRNGKKVDLRFEDLPPEIPFKNMEELRSELVTIIHCLQLPSIQDQKHEAKSAK